jgi:hypothetical protein
MRGHSIQTRQPGSLSSKIYALGRNPTVVTQGLDRSSTTTSSYNRITSLIGIGRPFILTALLWDIYAAGTYKFAFVDGSSATPTDVAVINAAHVAAGGSAEETIIATQPILLLTNQYYLSAYNASAVQYDRKGTIQVQIVSEDLYIRDDWNDGTLSTTGVIPVKLVGHYVDIFNLYNYTEGPII